MCGDRQEPQGKAQPEINCCNIAITLSDTTQRGSERSRLITEVMARDAPLLQVLAPRSTLGFLRKPV